MKVALHAFEISPRTMAALSRRLGRRATRLDARALLVRGALDAIDALYSDDVPAALESSLTNGQVRP